MKKNYISPATDIMNVIAEQIVATSFTKPAGDSGLDWGEGEAPDEADVKDGNYFGDSLFD